MTKIISAFPGTGKSYSTKHSIYKCHDSDSSVFHWGEGLGGTTLKRDWPNNYINHIKELRNSKQFDIIFISSHDYIRKLLVEHKIEYTLILPTKGLKEKYLKRYKERGSSEDFIKQMSDNWQTYNNYDIESVNPMGGRIIFVDYITDDILSKILTENIFNNK